MLVVSDGQMRCLAEGLTISWIDGFLRACYPESLHDIDATRIVAAMQDAQRRGFDTPPTLRRYVHLAFLLNWRLESDPALSWARDLLADDGHDADGRLLALQAAVLKQLSDADA